jgi:hypothetical protein
VRRLGWERLVLLDRYLVPTVLFVGVRSLIGFARWRIQRELWRRDVERSGSQR